MPRRAPKKGAEEDPTKTQKWGGGPEKPTHRPHIAIHMALTLSLHIAGHFSENLGWEMGGPGA